MTLAETASTFAEMILSDGMLSNQNIPDAQKLSILNIIVSSGIAFLMDIPIRYEFEKTFHEERMKGEVSVTRLKELMSAAQKGILGDLLEEGADDPYFWASKLHFYITEVTFYNFPYTFGFLLSQGIFNLFKKQGQSFILKYEEFLRQSGQDTAENVAMKTLGVNLETKDFWRASIRSLEPYLNQFEELASKVLG